MSLSKKEVFQLAGKVDAACILLQDVRQSLVASGMATNPNTTLGVVAKANASCADLRAVLRAVGYEIIEVKDG